jgi:hypothetical protein
MIRPIAIVELIKGEIVRDREILAEGQRWRKVEGLGAEEVRLG